MRYGYLYILKAVSAFMVVMVHVRGEVSELVDENIIRMFVPFFFMITGFFLVSPDGSIEIPLIKKYLRKAFHWFIALNLLYLVIQYIVNPASDFLDVWFRNLRMKKFWVCMLVYGCGIEPVLWYLGSLFWSLILLWWGVAHKKMRWLVWISIIGFVSGVVIGKYGRMLSGTEPAWYASLIPTNVGLPFMLAGILIRRIGYRKNLVIVSAVIFVIGICACYMENRFLSDLSMASSEGYLWLSAPAIILPVFYLCARSSEGKGNKIIEKIGQHTGSVFFFHKVLIYIMAAVPSLVMIGESYWAPAVIWIGILMISILAEKLYLNVSEWIQRVVN